MILQHYRFNTDCGVWEELEPIAQNLNYDFNYQQYVFLPEEHILLPVSVVQTKISQLTHCERPIYQYGW